MKMLFRVVFYLLGVIACLLVVALAWFPLRVARRVLRDPLAEERKKWPCEPAGACADATHCWTHSEAPPNSNDGIRGRG